jgi:DNA-directed RNA polymerase subunit H (RpoH/RPB5)
MLSQALHSPQPPHRRLRKLRRLRDPDRRHPDRVRVRDPDRHDDKHDRSDRSDLDLLRRELRRELWRVRQDDSRDSPDRDRVRRVLLRDPYSFLNLPLLSLDRDRAARLNLWLLRLRGMAGLLQGETEMLHSPHQQGQTARPGFRLSADHNPFSICMDDDGAMHTDAAAKANGGRTLSRAEEVSVAVEQERATLARAMTVLERMLTARGYNVSPMPEDAVVSGVHILLIGVVGDGLTADNPLPAPGTPMAASGAAPGTSIAVIHVDSGSVQTAREALARVKTHLTAVTRVVVVSGKKPTPFTQRFWSSQTCPAVDFFLYLDIQRAVIDHMLVKPHVVLTAEQAARVRARYAGGKLPVLWTCDPPVKLLGIEPGAMVMVEETWGRGPGSTTFFNVTRREDTA